MVCYASVGAGHLPAAHLKRWASHFMPRLKFQPAGFRRQGSEKTGLAGPCRSWLACRQCERTGGDGRGNCSGKAAEAAFSEGGQASRSCLSASGLPVRWRSAELAGRAGSCKANAQAEGNAEVVAVVRCGGPGSDGEGGWYAGTTVKEGGRPSRSCEVSGGLSVLRRSAGSGWRAVVLQDWCGSWRRVFARGEGGRRGG